MYYTTILFPSKDIGDYSMKVYALVGKSGTGKSYQAMNLCRDLDIEVIIDDGLLIYGNGILAGTSAKRQGTVIGAIKTALFNEDSHRNSVMGKIQGLGPNKILILGTSDKMVHRIAERLELPPIDEIIYIEDLTTEKERLYAKKQRHEMGKHVIPVPTFQLKKDFPGYFVDPLRIFKELASGRAGFSEKSVVRPTYSYMANFFISDNAISDIVNILSTEAISVSKVLRVTTITGKESVDITVLVMMKYGYQLIESAKEFQRIIVNKVSEMTAFNVGRVDVEIRGLEL